jgi:shikimate kinase
MPNTPLEPTAEKRGGSAANRWADQSVKSMIRLVGPGGAGKSTAGALLAQRLGVPFVDLDEEFVANVGDISRYLNSHGYDAYAKRNVDVYFALATVVAREAVLALSSGFMTYRPDIHPEYESCRRDIASSPWTFVLVPSLEFEACVAETVRRQLIRPFARSADGEEQVIRARLPIYLNIPAMKVETMRPVREVVDEIVAAQQTAAADDRGAAVFGISQGDSCAGRG